MAAVSKFSIKNQTKSLSLPCRSHPTTFEIEELLNKMKTTAAEPESLEAIFSGLSQLTRLYKIMNNLLTSSTIQVLMSKEQNKKWVDELVEESVKFLDSCGSISEMLSEVKYHSRDLLCALRRRKGELSADYSITKYNIFRKKVRKDVKWLVGILKRVDNVITGGGLVAIHSDDHQLAAVIRAVIGVSEMTKSVLESLLTFICGPVSKPKRWSHMVSKLMHKGRVACEDKNGMVNEFQSTDAALRVLCKYRSLSVLEGNVEIAQSRLERLGAQIESMESELECMFRCLVQTRVSLLNIISQ